MWLTWSRLPPEWAPTTLPVEGTRRSGREMRIRAWGAGSKRGRRKKGELVETWALARIEASPRIARLDGWLAVCPCSHVEEESVEGGFLQTNNVEPKVIEAAIHEIEHPCVWTKVRMSFIQSLIGPSRGLYSSSSLPLLKQVSV